MKYTPWEIETTNEYDAWFFEQAENEQEAVRMKVELLTEYGRSYRVPMLIH